MRFLSRIKKWNFHSCFIWLNSARQSIFGMKDMIIERFYFFPSVNIDPFL